MYLYRVWFLVLIYNNSTQLVYNEKYPLLHLNTVSQGGGGTQIEKSSI